MIQKIEIAGLKIVKLLKQSGWQAFFVGGIIRNNLLKKTSDNLDIATDAVPEEIERILSKAKINNKPIGKKFGSILAIVEGFPIEITTFRSEGRYSDNRHPDQVQFIKEYLNDAKRRDFTVNAIYFDPETRKTYDPTNGMKDIKARLLRFVGDPKKRIDEDALRMLRGVRLATELGFKLEKNAFAAIKTRAKYIQGISGERIKAELDKILLSQNRVQGFELLDKSGLLKFIMPSVDALKKVFHGSVVYHLEGSVFAHTKLVIEKIKIDDLRLIYAALLHDSGKTMKPVKKLKEEGWVWSYHGHEQKSLEIFNELAGRLKFSRADQNVISWLIKNHDNWRNFIDMKFKKQLRIVSHPEFRLMLELWRVDLEGSIRTDQDKSTEKRLKTQALGQKIIKSLEQAKPLIMRLAKGDLIMKYSNLKPGQQLGQKIEDVKAQIVLGKIRTEKDMQNYLRKQKTPQ